MEGCLDDGVHVEAHAAERFPVGLEPVARCTHVCHARLVSVVSDVNKESMVFDVSKEIYRCYNNGKTVGDEKTSKLLLTLYDKDNMLFIFLI